MDTAWLGPEATSTKAATQERSAVWIFATSFLTLFGSVRRVDGRAQMRCQFKVSG